MGISDEGQQLTPQDFAQILRSRWKTICGAIVIALLGAIAYSLLTPPQYEATTRLFIATPSDGNNSLSNEGGLFAQRRVLSYTVLLTGKILAQRTIDQLKLDMDAAELQQKITADAPTDTVLIDVKVRDSSPARARDIANTLSDEFVVMAAGLETPTLGGNPNAEVVVQQRAEVPTSPIAPKATWNLAIAISLGVLTGLLIAIIRDRLDKTVKSSEAIEKVVGQAVIADIPFDERRLSRPTITFENDRSAIAEAFRELRTNVKLVMADDAPRVILIASPTPNEGRTATAVNLALALTEAGHKVAIVDGDLRRPGIASILDVDEPNGFSTVVTGKADLNVALKETRFPRLTALTAGELPTNPAELLGSNEAKAVLNELGMRFDYVIVDSSPLLVTDAAILAGSAQGVLMIARSGRTKLSELARATQALRRTGTPLLGAVLTMTPARNRTRNYDDYNRSEESQARARRWGRGGHRK